MIIITITIVNMIAILQRNPELKLKAQSRCCLEVKLLG